MSDILKSKSSGVDISNCFGKSCLVELAKLLNVQKVLTGSVERFGGKIIITLRLIDVKTSVIEKMDVTEFQNLQSEMQHMIEISVKNIVGIENDKHLVNVLVNYEEPIFSTRTNLSLNGPRMGIAYITGDMAEVLTAPKSKGGYDVYPFLSQFGYQHEVQYVSAGEFQALVEFLVVASGMEQQLFIPTIAFLNGFRINKSGWEIAFGPNLSINKEAEGFYDKNSLMGGDANEWYIVDDWYELHDYENILPYDTEKRMDRRGVPQFNLGWIWAIGKTFKSGYLNIPVNLYVSPSKKGSYFGVSVGFNVSKKRKVSITDEYDY